MVETNHLLPARYTIEVFYSDEDSGFIAVAKDLPGCSAFGKTPADAAAEIQHAIKAWREAAKTAGNPVPEPARHEAEPSRPSGKILLRIPRSLHASLIDRAKLESVSLNQHLVSLLSMSVGALSSWSAHGFRTYRELAVSTANTAGTRVEMRPGSERQYDLVSDAIKTLLLGTAGSWQTIGQGEKIVQTRERLDVRQLPANLPGVVEER
jgi:predicted RNase H-like HicB family nuclease